MRSGEERFRQKLAEHTAGFRGFLHMRGLSIFLGRREAARTGSGKDPREGRMTDGVVSQRRQEDWRSKTQVGWLALNKKIAHPPRLR